MSRWSWPGKGLRPAEKPGGEILIVDGKVEPLTEVAFHDRHGRLTKADRETMALRSAVSA